MKKFPKLCKRMMKNKTTFLILSFIIFPLFLSAIHVNLTDAKQVAKNWYLERSNEYLQENVEIIETFFISENSQDIYYVFNFREGGYIIIAADNAVIPVLGYNFEHHYGTENHPPQFDAMLESYKEQIIYTKENNFSAPPETKVLWERLNVKTEDFKSLENIKSLGPLLNSTWNQGNSWNAYCPADPNGPGGHVYAGCVAVAMAQVMNYWEHPAIGVGSHGYTHSTYGYLFADFSATIYDFPMNYTSPTDPSRELLFHCGVSVDMNYSTSGSGASNTSALSALETYFNYDPSAYIATKSNYTNIEWENLIRENLDNGRPLCYFGQGSAGGHAFNLDGYDDTNTSYFHFNWGWSGSYNGYYYLDNLNPAGYNFSTNQNAILDLFPGQEPEITVMSPNGGEIWGMGEIYNVTWDYFNVIGNIKIDLYKDETLVCQLEAETPVADGNQDVFVPPDLIVGNDYRIVVATPSGYVLDFSDDYFTIEESSLLIEPANLNVSESGYATWNAPGGGGNGTVISLHNGYVDSGVGTGGEASWNCAVRFDSAFLDTLYGSDLIAVNIHIRTADFTYVEVNVWEGGSFGDPGTLIYQQDVTNSVLIEKWTTHTLTTPIPLITGNEYWVGYYIDAIGDYPSSTDAGPVAAGFGDWMFTNGEWLEISTSFSLDLNWCIEGVVGLGKNTRVFSGYNVYLDEIFVDYTPNRFWQYTDLVNGQTYIAGVEAVYDEGVSEIVTTTFTHNTVGIDNIIVTSNELTGNYPNPFNTETTITFSLTENTENTELSIYNIRGRKVKTLINKELSAGRHLVVWDAKDENNKQVPCGTYFYKIKAGKFTSTKKMILMKYAKW